MFFSRLDVVFDYSLYSFRNFPCYLSLNMNWNWGFILFMFLIIQYCSGFYLSLYLAVGVEDECLFSKAFIIKELSWGWLFSYLHSFTPSVLFFFMFIHIFKVYVFPIKSYFFMWLSGVFLFVFFVALAFTGYSLVYGAMSYWALVVIQNIVFFIFGEYVSSFLLFSSGILVGGFTLIKISIYHYVLSVVVLFFVYLHIWFLHKGGSSNCLYSSYIDTFSFFNVSFSRDILLLVFTLFFYCLVLFFFFDWFISYENSSFVNVFLVPEEISPEWFLRFFFIVLKSTNSKLFGIVFMGFVFLGLGLRFLTRGLFNINVYGVSFMFFFGGLFVFLILFMEGTFGSGLYVASFLLFGFFGFLFDFMCILEECFEILDCLRTLCKDLYEDLCKTYGGEEDNSNFGFYYIGIKGDKMWELLNDKRWVVRVNGSWVLRRFSEGYYVFVDGCWVWEDWRGGGDCAGMQVSLVDYNHCSKYRKINIDSRDRVNRVSL